MPDSECAQTFDEHVFMTVQSTAQPTSTDLSQSHLQWLHRMYYRVMLRQLELDRREDSLNQREAAIHQSKKYKTHRNTHAHRGSHDARNDNPTI